MNASGGFSMIELMVAVLIISVGLLGVAKIDAVTVSEGTVSTVRLAIVNDVASLAGAMRANEMYWQTSTVPTFVSVSAGTAQQGGSTLSVTAPSELMSSQIPSGNCTNSSLACTPAQMAALDLQQYATVLSQVIPGGFSSISCTQAASATSPAICQVSVQWSENQVAINNAVHAAAAKQPTQTQIYTQMVQP